MAVTRARQAWPSMEEMDQDMYAENELTKLQTIMSVIQHAVYSQEGIIKEFGVEDKGTVVVCGFGLPPLTHPNEPLLAFRAAQKIHEGLGKVPHRGRVASQGVTSPRSALTARLESQPATCSVEASAARLNPGRRLSADSRGRDGTSTGWWEPL